MRYHELLLFPNAILFKYALHKLNYFCKYFRFWIASILRQQSKYNRVPLSSVIFLISSMLKVTAGFMWTPPNSPRPQAKPVTTEPMPRAVWTPVPSSDLPQDRGRAHCTDTNRNVAMNSATTSRHHPPLRTSEHERSSLHVKAMATNDEGQTLLEKVSV